jgi:acetate kinase
MHPILTLNAGSSSLKFALFTDGAQIVLRGEVEGIGDAPHITAKDADQRSLDVPDLAGKTQADILPGLLGWLQNQLHGARLEAVGHRVVHGGEDFAAPVRIDAAILARLEALIPLAPLHQPSNLAPIRALARSHPDMVQVACFDTAFHRTMPALATLIALPRAFGLRRYGFHGLSYEYVTGRLRALAPGLARGRVILAHLGSGASLCATLDGSSIETTMGFSVLDGLLMGTRPGTIDPGALLYLLQSRGLSPEALTDLLYHQSGLLGVSGISADMRALAESDTPGARQAIDLFAYRLAGEAARLTAALGGLDGLVFTGGIGENDAPLRAAICARLAWLGATIDPARDAHGGRRIDREGGSLQVWVIPTDEEAMIARHTRALLSG